MIGGSLVQSGTVTAVWWGMESLVLVAGLLGTAALFAWQRMAAGYGRLPAITSLGGCAVALAVLVLWGSRCPIVEGAYVAEDEVCASTDAGTEVCLAAEEEPLLPEAVSDVINTVEMQLRTGSSDTVVSELLPIKGQDDRFRFSPGLKEQSRFDIAASYTGLDQCDEDVNLPTTEFSTALTFWAVQDPETIEHLNSGAYAADDYTSLLFSMPDDDVVDLYRAHRDGILNCEYAPQLEQ